MSRKPRNTGRQTGKQGGKPGNTPSKTAGNKPNVKKQQPKKDSKSPRINEDNARVDRVMDELRGDAKKPGANASGLYSRNPELLRAAGSIPFASILGSRYGANDGAAVPGIISMPWTPAFGPGLEPIAINQASDSTYSFIVHANSRDYSSTAPDYLLFAVAGMEVFLIITSMIRAVGSIKDYQEETVYRPDDVVRAQGFDPVDLRQNLGQAWFDINNLVNQSRQIWVPNAFPVMERWFTLCSNIYKDAEGERAQLYIPVKDQYFILSETGSPNGTALATVLVDGTPEFDGSSFSTYRNPETKAFRPGSKMYPWNQWVAVAQAMLNALVSSEDRGMIYGNILNAYGKDALYFLPEIPANYIVEPIYNSEMLLQIENTVTSECYVPCVLQYEEQIRPAWYLNSTKGAAFGGSVIGAPQTAVMNFHTTGQPDPELVAVAGRNMTLGLEGMNVTKPGTNGGTTYTTLAPRVVGSELFHMFRMFTKSRVMGSDTPLNNHGYVLAQCYATGAQWSDAMMDMEAFDWHPFIYSISSTSVPGDTEQTTPTLNKLYNDMEKVNGDFDNYTEVSKREVQKLQDMALYSLWGVPQI